MWSNCIRLREDWERCHIPVAARDCPQLGNVEYVKPTACQLAGFCLHKPQYKYLKSFIIHFQHVMRKFVAKGKDARRFHDMSA